MKVLLTNDDGIDAVGIQTMYDRLSEIAEVTVVAPLEDQSAVGRQLSQTVEVHEHETGYAIEGTPSDCIIAGIGSLGIDPDIVVSGANQGANLGSYVLGRSGTVSAAVEATFFGVPAIATSVYFPGDEFSFEDFTPKPIYFREAARAVEYLVEGVPETDIFETADYLNVNAPLPPDEGSAPMTITHPSRVYEMGAERDGRTIEINDRIWRQMAEGNIPDSDGSDRRVVFEGSVSVSPLSTPHASVTHDGLDEMARLYE
jgi:5'-nucleotidase